MSVLKIRLKFSGWMLFLFFNIPEINAQQRFEQISINQGLSHSIVSSIVQDRQGFLWIGTQSGLNRFDGYNFKYFGPKSIGRETIQNQGIKTIFIDSRGLIWISYHNAGISVFNSITDKFTNYPFFQGKLFRNEEVNAFFEDSKKRIWIATTIGLIRFDADCEKYTILIPFNENLPKAYSVITSIAQGSDSTFWIGTGCGIVKFYDNSNIYSRYRITQTNNSLADTTGENSIPCLLVDNKNFLWIGTGSKGLYYVTPDIVKGVQNRISLTGIGLKLPSGNYGYEIHSLFRDSKGYIWVGHNKGVSMLSNHTRLPVLIASFAFDDKYNDVFGKNIINTIAEDHNNNIWFAPYYSSNGLFCFNRKTNTLEVYKHSVTERFSLTNKHITCIFEDRYGVLWLGTLKDGLYKLDLYAKRFNYIGNNKESIEGNLNSNDVFSIYNDAKDNLWVGTDKGLNKLNVKRQLIRKFEYNALNKTGIQGNIVGVIYPLPVNKLAVGLLDAQFSIFDTKNESFTNYTYNPSSVVSSVCWSVRAIVSDNYRRLWLANYSTGFASFANNQFTYFSPTQLQWQNVKTVIVPHNLPDISTNALMLDKDNNLWVGLSYGGITIYNTNKQQFIENEQLLNRIKGVNCIYQDSKNTIWIGSVNMGIYKVTLQKGIEAQYTMKQGLPNNTIQGIIEGTDSCLWISTNDGLSRFNPLKNVFRNYSFDDGIPSNEFNQNALCKGLNNDLFFGGVNGITWFKPLDILDNPRQPDIVISGMKIFNISVNVGDTVNGQVVLLQTISNTRHITLNYKNDDISFEFAALHYCSPNKNQYKYKLEGYDKAWKETDYKLRNASYTRLPAGDYIFKVIASNNDGLWNQTGISLKITILPPWWKTWWFKVLVWSCIIILLWVVYVYRIKILERRNRILEERVSRRTRDLLIAKQDVEERQKEIVRQNEVLEENYITLQRQKEEIEIYSAKLHETDQSKIEFLTNVSHEIRTPLTIIKGPIDKLSDLGTKLTWEKAHTCIDLISKNTDRLIKLVNQMFDIRKLENKTLLLQTQVLCLQVFVSNIVEFFEPLSEQNNIKLKCCFSIIHDRVYMDADIIEKMLFNLLSNAYKYTPNGGEIEIRISQSEVNNDILIVRFEVADNGVGIAEHELPRVFERFYQSGNKNKQRYEGSGIGLALTAELVKLHSGTIEVNSTVGNGTTFTVDIPVTIVKDNESIIFNSTNEIESIQEIELPKNSENNLYTILIVEDMLDLRQYLASELGNNCNIITANNGEEGLQQSRLNIPDIIISDVMMPIMDGIEMTRLIKNDILTCHIPVILLTARVAEDQQIEGLLTGADDYIAKPFNIKTLKLKVANVLESRRKLVAKVSSNPETELNEAATNTLDEDFIQKVISIVYEHLSDSDFDADQLCQALNMSKSNFYKKIKALTGCSVNIFVRNIRLKESAKLLKTGRLNISQVAYELGFSDPGYFTRCFVEYFGVTPSKYFLKE